MRASRDLTVKSAVKSDCNGAIGLLLQPIAIEGQTTKVSKVLNWAIKLFFAVVELKRSS